MGEDSEAPRPDAPTRTSATVPDAVSDTRSAPTVDAVGDTVASASAKAPALAFPTVRTDVYVVGAELGRGGMGRVVSAYDTRLDRPVAIKELLVRSEALELRFAREARITAKLQHPAIVPVHEAGQWPDGSRFYTMKLIEGQPLDQLISAAQTLAERLALVPKIATVCEAIAYAHKQRVIHRDLKPSNILVGEFGETLVVDWGIAKELDASLPDEVDEAAKTTRLGGDATAIGSVLGTPAYMPLEQALGEPVDERADVYSLGAVLYSLLTRRLPYSASSSDGVLAEVVAGPPVSIKSLEPDVPPELVAIVEKAMHRDRAARYANGGELVSDLQRYINGQLVGSHRYTVGQLARRWARRHRGALAVSVAAFALLAVVGGFAIWRIIDARNAADAAARQAEIDRDISASTTAKLLIDSARREFLDGDAGRAAAYLAQTYQSNGPPSLQLLTGLVRERLMRSAAWRRPENIAALRIDSKSQQVVVLEQEGRVRTFDVSTGEEVVTSWSDIRTGYAISANGRFVFSRSADRSGGQLWSRTGVADIPNFAVGEKPKVVVADSGDRVVASDDIYQRHDEYLHVWTRGAQAVRSVDVSECPVGGLFNMLECDARCNVVLTTSSRCALVVNLESGAKDLRELGARYRGKVGNVSSSDPRVILTGAGGQVLVRQAGAWRTFDPPEPEETIALSDEPKAISDEATHVLTVARNSITLVTSDGERQAVEVGERIVSAAISAGGGLVVVSTNNGYAHTYLTSPLRRIQVDRAEGAVDVSRDGRIAVVGKQIIRMPLRSSTLYKRGGARQIRFVTNDGVSQEGVDLLLFGAAGYDISDDESRELVCVSDCAMLVARDRASGRELRRIHWFDLEPLHYFEGRSEAWLSRDFIVRSSKSGNILTPLRGGPAVSVTACNATNKAKWWMSEDGTRVFCPCSRSANCPVGEGYMIAVDLSNPSVPASTLPAGPAAPCFSSFGVMRGDVATAYGCNATASLLDRSGNVLCSGSDVAMGNDGNCYALQGAGRNAAAPINVLRVRAGTKPTPLRTFGRYIRAVEIRGSVLYAQAEDFGMVPGGIELWDANDGTLIGRIDVPGIAKARFGVSADGRTVVVGTKYFERLTISVPMEQSPTELVRPWLAWRSQWTVDGAQLLRKPE